MLAGRTGRLCCCCSRLFHHCAVRLLYAPLILIDRVATGCVNFARDPCYLLRRDRVPKPLDNIFDIEPALNRISQAARGAPLCGPMRHTFDAGHADGSSRLPLPGASTAAEGERRVRIEEAFRRIVALRHAFDALDASSGDNGLSAAEVDALFEPRAASQQRRTAADGAGGAANGASPPSTTTAADLPADAASPLVGLASSMRRYMRQHGKAHLAFSELVLLCRDQAVW